MPKEEWDKEKNGSRAPRSETVNQASALWARPKADVTSSSTGFLQAPGHDFGDALAGPQSGRGSQRVHQLLYLPARLRSPVDRKHQHGLKLYVRRVFIMDDAEQLLPSYLRFVRVCRLEHCR